MGYTVIQDERGGLYALRRGEPWRDCCGDGLILALAQEIEELREERDKLRDRIADLEGEAPRQPVPTGVRPGAGSLIKSFGGNAVRGCRFTFLAGNSEAFDQALFLSTQLKTCRRIGSPLMRRSFETKFR